MQHTATHCPCDCTCAIPCPRLICTGSVLQCMAVCCSVWQCVAGYGSVLQCMAVCCSECHGAVRIARTVGATAHMTRHSLQHNAAHCNKGGITHATGVRAAATYLVPLMERDTQYNALQHTATHCNTLQHTATHCNTGGVTRAAGARGYRRIRVPAARVAAGPATHCNSLHRTTSHCNTLQHRWNHTSG